MMVQPFFIELSEILSDQANKLDKVDILWKSQFLSKADPGNFCTWSCDFQDL